MKSLSKILLIAYLFILLWLILFKFSVDITSVSSQAGSLNLIPFANYAQGNQKELIYNFLVFVPFGLFLSLNLTRTDFWQKLALVFAFSFGMEMIQLFFAIGATDITDVISNTSGGFAGLVAYELSKKHIENEKLDQLIAVAGAVLLTLSVLFLGFLFSNGVRFQPSPSARMHR